MDDKEAAMSFALTIVKLEEALRKRGCPVCRLENTAAAHSIDTFLWENVNDAEIRKPINDAYGFCPSHTRLLVAKEMMSSGPLLGVNIIYALLAKNASHDLKNTQRGANARRNFSGLLEKLGFGKDRRPNSTLLEASGICPACILVEQSGRNTLSTLYEELNTQTGKIFETYQGSSGICMRHLKIGWELFGQQYPLVGAYLIEDAAQRLDTQRGHMLEFIRKQNYAYKDDPLTDEERGAWQRTLEFFTGLPADKFTHHIDKF